MNNGVMKPMRQWLLFFLLVVPGVACFVFCMYHALQDWAALSGPTRSFNVRRTFFIGTVINDLHSGIARL